MHPTQRLDAQPKVASSATRGEVSQVDQMPQGLILARRLRGRERFDFGPQSGLAPDETVQVSLPGERRFPFAPRLFLGPLLGLAASPLLRLRLGSREQFCKHVYQGGVP